MGTGFVAALPAADAVDLARETRGRVIGSVALADDHEAGSDDGDDGDRDRDGDGDGDGDEGVVEIRGHRLR
jgi:hypothetical protein